MLLLHAHFLGACASERDFGTKDSGLPSRHHPNANRSPPPACSKKERPDAGKQLANWEERPPMATVRVLPGGKGEAAFHKVLPWFLIGPFLCKGATAICTA